jgi:putative PIN family toxin of toxin-antitoxin system
MTKIVIDTNVLLSILPKASSSRIILEKIIEQEVEVYVSTSILLEYKEIISSKTNINVANNFLEFFLKLPNVVQLEPSYIWQLIENDPDDNKFVDLALMAGCDFIITNDRHFEILKQIPFQKVNILTHNEFRELLNF